MVKILASLVAAAQAANLAVTWEDCGAKHGKVTSLVPATIEIGSTTAVTGTGKLDEDVTSASFTAVVSAKGHKVVSCSGDGTKDIECKLPLGAGSVVVKALTFPLKKGKVEITTEVKTSSKIPASLANVDVHVTATDQNKETAVCMDVHTKKAAELEEPVEVTGGTLAVTWEDCGAKHGKVTSLKPSTVAIGSTTAVTGTGQLDEDVTSASVNAVVSAKGHKVVSCSGDGTKDIECKLPLGAGSVVVKALTFPLKKGKITIPVEVKTSSAIPASLANVDVHVTATEQNKETALCMDVHTKKAATEILV